jgi:hypothetical protein
VTPAYRLDIRDTSGVLQAVVTDYTYLTYTRQVNKVGMLQFALSADHDAVQYLTDKALVEVWRRDATRGVDWHCDYYGMVRTTQYAYPGSGPETFTVWAPSMLSLLGWRVVAWHAGTANRSAFDGVKAETVLNTLVSYNACAAATTANGRLRDGAITGLTAEAGGAGGNTVDWNCAYANLLQTCQELCRISGGDMDVVTTAPATWQWRWYAGQLGTDRSATVVLALNRGNMASPTYIDARADERTVAIVGGQGEGTSRATSIRTGTNYNAGTNNVEFFRDARNESTAEGLNSAGDAGLDEARARATFTFDLIQTPALRYGAEFFLGDLVTARYRGYETTVKVKGVTVSVSPDGTESMTFEVEEA